MSPVRSFDSLLLQAQKTRIRRGHHRSTQALQSIWCDLASNDYLRLSSDRRVLDAGHKVLDEYGTSARASRVVSGTLPVHADAEHSLADLTQMPSGLLFSSGYMANLAVIAALGRAGTRILLDAHIHASLHDAAKLCAADVEIFEHQNLNHLRELLRHGDGKPTLIVVEGVYSVLGDAADLANLQMLARQYEAWLVADESHSLGILDKGCGACSQAGISGADNLIITSSLGKALGSAGGVVLCPETVRDYLINTSRPFIFDTALSPVNAAAAAASARIVGTESERLSQQVFENAQCISTALGTSQSAGAMQSVGIDGTGNSSEATEENCGYL